MTKKKPFAKPSIKDSHDVDFTDLDTCHLVGFKSTKYSVPENGSHVSL